MCSHLHTHALNFHYLPSFVATPCCSSADPCREYEPIYKQLWKLLFIGAPCQNVWLQLILHWNLQGPHLEIKMGVNVTLIWVILGLFSGVQPTLFHVKQQKHYVELLTVVWGLGFPLGRPGNHFGHLCWWSHRRQNSLAKYEKTNMLVNPGLCWSHTHSSR